MSKGIFERVQLFKPKRAKFDLSHERKMSIPFGALIPTFVSEVLPGDSFRVQANMLARFQALLAPVMHRVNVYTHFFYVPYRILNQDFARFINYQGNRPNLSVNVSSSPFFLIQDAKNVSVNGATGNGLKDGSLLDYLGFPTAPNDVTFPAAFTVNPRISALLPLAYQRAWNDWYRDQNFTQAMWYEDGDSQAFSSTSNKFFGNIIQFDGSAVPDYETVNGPTSTALGQLLTLRWRAWEKDYLTSALPYANQGIGDPRVPISVPAGALGNTPAAGAPMPSAYSTFGKTGGIQYPGSVGNPTDQGGFTLSALRIAAALKRWLENSARGGVRYVEMLWHHWFVQSSDARLSRAEYLGGGVQPMVVSEVVTNAPATSEQTGVPPGYLAGHGVSFGTSNKFTRRFEEHGVVIGITSVLPRTAYLYSMPRAFMRSEPLDYAWPEFSQLGEQQVIGSEVFFKIETNLASASAPNYTTATSTNAYLGLTDRYPMGYQGTGYTGFDLQNDNPEAASVNGSAWGFQGRYAEYKYLPDTVHGLFRSSLSFWHFGRMLSPSTLLNYAFIKSNPRVDPFAVLPTNGATGQYDQHPILLQVYNRVSVLRSLPYFNTPQLW